MIFLSGLWIDIANTTLLLSITMTLLLNRSFLAFVNIAWKNLLLYYHIYFVNIVIDVK